jgi:hypothetical protein
VLDVPLRPLRLFSGIGDPTLAHKNHDDTREVNALTKTLAERNRSRRKRSA